MAIDREGFGSGWVNGPDAKARPAAKAAGPPVTMRLPWCKMPMFCCCHVQFGCGCKVSREDVGGPAVGKHFLNKTSKVRGRKPKLTDWNAPKLQDSIQRMTRLSGRWWLGEDTCNVNSD